MTSQDQLLGATVGMAGNIANTVMTQRMNQRASDTAWERQNAMYNKQLSDNRQLTQEARDYERQRLSDERAYNDPNEQQRRLKNAGINPAIAMQSGTVNTSSGSSIPAAAGASPGSVQQQHAAQNPNFDPLGAILAKQQVAHQQALIDKTNAETENISNTNSLFPLKAEQEKNILALQGLQIAGGDVANQLSSLQLSLNKATFDNKVAMSSQELAISRASYDKICEEITSAKFQNSLNPLTKQQLENTIAMQGAQFALMRFDLTHLKPAELAGITALTAKHIAESKLIRYGEAGRRLGTDIIDKGVEYLTPILKDASNHIPALFTPTSTYATPEAIKGSGASNPMFKRK